MPAKWVLILAVALAAAVFTCGFLVGRGARQVETVTVTVHDTTIIHDLVPDTFWVVDTDTIWIDSTTPFGDIPIRERTVSDSFRVSWTVNGKQHSQLLGVDSWVQYRGALYAIALSVPKDFVVVETPKPSRLKDYLDFRASLGVSIVPSVIPEGQAEVILFKRVGAYGRVEYNETWKCRAGFKIGVEL